MKKEKVAFVVVRYGKNINGGAGISLSDVSRTVSI